MDEVKMELASPQQQQHMQQQHMQMQGEDSFSSNTMKLWTFPIGYYDFFEINLDRFRRNDQISNIIRPLLQRL